MGSQIFISYSHKDRTWLDKLKKVLKPLERTGEISVFSDLDTKTGEDWRSRIQQELESAEVAILLVSQDFLASDFIAKNELPPLLRAAKEKRLTIFWIALRPSTVDDTDIVNFQAANEPSRPLSSLFGHKREAELVGIRDKVKAVIRERQAVFPPGDGTDSPPLPSPYPGLKPFDESQAPYFHGRRDEIKQMRKALETCRLLMVIGPSGSGKSSLVFAGLLPELKSSTPCPWEVLPFRPQQNPATNLIRRFPDVLKTPQKAVAHYLASSTGASRLLLIIDQFEECFTLAAEEERERFFTVIQKLRRVTTCTVVLTLRAVFVEDLMLSGLWPAKKSEHVQRVDVTPLRGDRMREAIVEPAKAAGVKIEKGLVELLLADAAGEPGRLPLLQTTLKFLWDKIQNGELPLRHGELPLEAYKELGGEGRQRVAHALARKADDALDSLSPAEQQVVHRIFLRLIQFVEGRPETRRQQPLLALQDGAESQSLVEQMVNKLADHGLLVMDWQGDNKLVDLAHEALITAWPRLRDWIAQGRKPEQERRDWESKAAEWLKGNKKKDFLLAEEPLRRVQEWLRSPGAAFVSYSRALAEFAEASRKAMDEKQGIRRKWRAAELANQAKNLLEIDPDLAMRLAMEAVTMTWNQGQPPVAPAEDALRLTLVHTPVRRIVHDHQGEVLGMAVSPNGRLLATAGAEGTAKVWDVASGELMVSMNGHTGPVYGAAFDPGGACLATAGGDSTVRIWDLDDGRQISKLTGHEGIVTRVAYCPTGNFLITAGEDPTARVWDLSTKKVYLELRGHRRPIRAVAFDPTGTRVATAGDDAILRIWNMADGEEILALLGHVNRVWDVSWESLDSVATAGEDRMVRIWDAIRGFPRLVRKRHTVPVRSVCFDSSGGLLTASEDGTVRIWGTQDGEVEVVRTLSSPGARLIGAAYGQSEAESFVLATDADGTTRLWRTTDGQEIVAHRFDDVCRLGDAVFSPAGLRTLLLVPGNTSISAPDKSYAQVRDLESGAIVTALQEKARKLARAGAGSLTVETGGFQATIPSHASGVNFAEYSPDGQLLATASQDWTARIWDANSGREVAVLEGHEGPVRRVSWSPDGRWVVTAGEDHTARIWAFATGEQVQELKGHTGKVYAAVFSLLDHELRIATASADGTIRIWDCAGNLLHDLREHEASVNDVVWSPDGHWAATASQDGTVRIWNWAEERSKHILRGHEGSVLGLAWSPDGRTLASAGKDGTVRLWDTGSGELRATLRGHSVGVRGVAFSRDGKRVVSTGHDRTIRQYLVNVEDLLEEATARNPRQLTQAERARYLGETAESAPAVEPPAEVIATGNR
jgi:WD40 repeat protein/energy-coupling factor transporter ATP-binding protein EcfA2